jgi:hypothetical protein
MLSGIGLLRDPDGIFHATNSMSIYPDTGVRVIKPDKALDGQLRHDHSMIVAPTVVPRWFLFLLFGMRCI